MRILLADNEAQAAVTIQRALKASGAMLKHTETGEKAVLLAKQDDFDAIILELAFPDIDGYEVIRRLRGSSVMVPILVLSTLTHPQAKVKAFTLGADDFLSRPFHETELAARIQALVRRSKGLSQSTIVVGPIVLNMASHLVTVNGKTVHLAEKEYRILELLFLRGGTIVSRESFLTHLYGEDDDPASKIIDVFLYRLRRKLSLVGAGHVITTIWGRGLTVRDGAVAAVTASRANVPV